MDIDTATVRRLRDALLVCGQQEGSVRADGGARPRDRGRQAALERVAPFVETMYLMMMVDGEADGQERIALRGALLALTDGLLESEVLDELLQRCCLAVAEQGVEARLQAIGSRICANRQDRELAFTLAAAVALADGAVADEESLLVRSIGEWFGVSTRRCHEILQQFEQAG